MHAWCVVGGWDGGCGGQVWYRVHPPAPTSTAPHYTTPTQVTTTTTAVMFPALLYTTAELSAAFLYTIAAPFPSLMFPAAFTLAHSAELSVTFHLSSNLLRPTALSTQW